MSSAAYCDVDRCFSNTLTINPNTSKSDTEQIIWIFLLLDLYTVNIYRCFFLFCFACLFFFCFVKHHLKIVLLFHKHSLSLDLNFWRRGFDITNNFRHILSFLFVKTIKQIFSKNLVYFNSFIIKKQSKFKFKILKFENCIVNI